MCLAWREPGWPGVSLAGLAWLARPGVSLAGLARLAWPGVSLAWREPARPG